MNDISASAPLRVARPTRELATIERFWVGGVGLDVLWRNDQASEGEHRLLMVGVPGAAWHLEIVDDSRAADQSRPGPEDLLVLYLGERPEPAWLDRIVACGGTVVRARNPYWDRWGVTVEDPDGYLLVLSHRTWE